MKAIFISSTNTVKLTGLTDLISEEYENAATVTYTLRNKDLEVVSGASGVSMAYVSDSDGDYRGTLTHTVAATLTNGEEYYLDVLVVKGSKQHTRRVVCSAIYDDDT